MNVGRTVAAGVAILTFFGAATSASAATFVDLIWRVNGTSILDPTDFLGSGADLPDAADGVSYVLDVVLRVTDATPVGGVFIGFLFDTDLENELNYTGGAEFSEVAISMGNKFTPFALGVAVTESGAATAGLIENFDQQTLATGLANGTRTLGSFKFTVNTAMNSAADVDIIASIIGNGVDTGLTQGAGSGADVPFTANGASVVGVPEPTTALLVVLGLAGLGFAGRRSLR